MTMDAAKSVTATFTLKTNALDVTKAGSGGGDVTSTPAGIDCGSTCGFSFDYGTVVTLTATPVITSTFTGWTGSCTGAGTCVVTMSAARSVTATFGLGANATPVAEGGLDQMVSLGSTVTLNGSGSYDPVPARLPLSYAWAQTGGPIVTFSPSPALSVTTFTAPSAPTVLTFTLTVTDYWGLASTPDEVVVKVAYLAYLPLTVKNYP